MCFSGSLLVARQQFLAEGFDLPPDFRERQQPLIALPYEPLRMDILDHRIESLSHLIDSAGVSEIGALHAFDVAFGLREHSVRDRELRFVLGLAPGFEKSEVVEELAESDAADSTPGESARLVAILREVHRVQHTDSLPEVERASRFARLFTIRLGEFANCGRLRDQDRRCDPLARAPAHGFFADRKSLEQRRMRFLVRLRHYADLLDAPEFIDLAGKAELASPFLRQPGRAFLRVGILVVFALEAERLVGPREFEKAEHFLERLAIDAIGFALVAGGGLNVNLLRHLVEPSRLIAAREADEGAALGQLIKP